VTFAAAGCRLPGVAKTRRSPIEDRIQEVFRDYSDTLTLVREYATARQHPVELGILVCARLDSLANLAGLGKTQPDRFRRFLEEYSGQKSLLQKIAIPNLYTYLGRHHDFLPLTVEIPGRIQQFDRDKDLPFIRFVSESDLPITDEAIGAFLRWFSRVVQRKYRTTATQSRKKPSLDTHGSFGAHLADAAASRRSDAYVRAVAALQPLIGYFSLGSILYREFRSGIIHEFGFSIDESEFFRKSGVYLSTISYEYDETVHLDIQFSASWLIDVFSSCLTNYRKHLLATRKLPPGLFFEICDVIDEVDLLDDDGLPDPQDIRLALGR
jgi:hypothetical protein